MKISIIAIIFLSALANAKNIIDCSATVLVGGMSAVAPAPVLHNQSGAKLSLAGPNILKIQVDEISLKAKETVVALDSRSKNIEFLVYLSLKAVTKGPKTEIQLKLDDKIKQQGNSYTLNSGNSLEASLQNKAGQTLKISCSYGFFNFGGI
jgi:uncharacterized cupredoxin-like copper-binding protein